jgi:hypothetical protein
MKFRSFECRWLRCESGWHRASDTIGDQGPAGYAQLAAFYRG